MPRTCTQQEIRRGAAAAAAAGDLPPLLAAPGATAGRGSACTLPNKKISPVRKEEGGGEWGGGEWGGVAS